MPAFLPRQCVFTEFEWLRRNDQNSVDVMNRLQDVGIGCEKARSPNAYTYIQYADLF